MGPLSGQSGWGDLGWWGVCGVWELSGGYNAPLAPKQQTQAESTHRMGPSSMKSLLHPKALSVNLLACKRGTKEDVYVGGWERLERGPGGPPSVGGLGRVWGWVRFWLGLKKAQLNNGQGVLNVYIGMRLRL